MEAVLTVIQGSGAARTRRPPRAEYSRLSRVCLRAQLSRTTLDLISDVELD